jgi:hypothetical protein
MLTLVVLTGFAALAGLFLYLTVLDAGRRRKKLDAILLPVGFQALAKAEFEPVAKRLRIVRPRHAGKRLLMRLYRRASPTGGYQLYVCDYYFASASGRARGATGLLVCLVSDALALPRLHIESVPAKPGSIRSLHHVLADAMDIPGARHWLTGDDDFDRRYQIHYFEGDHPPALPARFMALLRETPGGLDLDMAGDAVIVSNLEMMADRVRRELDAQSLQGLIHRAPRVFEALKSQVGLAKAEEVRSAREAAAVGRMASAMLFTSRSAVV